MTLKNVGNQRSTVRINRMTIRLPRHALPRVRSIIKAIGHELGTSRGLKSTSGGRITAKLAAIGQGESARHYGSRVASRLIGKPRHNRGLGDGT